MAASSSSEEESAAGTSPEPAQQEQAASPMEAMMAMILQKVGGIQEAVDHVHRLSCNHQRLRGCL